MSNIKNNNYKTLDCNLYNDRYTDFMLYGGNVSDGDIGEYCLSSDISFCNVKDCNSMIFSNMNWDGAVNKGETISDIGLTGIDNGFITYKKDRISNEEFIKIYTESELELGKMGNRFFVKKVDGNTLNYVYPIECHEEYSSLKGGFYQGFFKLEGFGYQTLPSVIEDEWNFEIKFRKRNDYSLEKNIVNDRYPENKGIIFYIGTRAENKFWPLYKIDKKTEQFKNKKYNSDEYGNGFFTDKNNVTEEPYQTVDEEAIKNQGCYNCNCDCKDGYFEDGEDPYFLEGYESENNVSEGIQTEKHTGFPDDVLNRYGYDEHSRCRKSCDDGCNDVEDENICVNTKYFGDEEYLGTEEGIAFDEEYIEPDISLKDSVVTDSESHRLDKKGYFEIETDNKFLIFDRTENGFNANTWDDGNKFILTGAKDYPNINYFPLLHRGKGGKTVEDLDDIIEENRYPYDIFKDITGNCFAIQIKDDGSIGYKYGVLDCDSENRFSVKEEFSKKGLIKDNVWQTINIKMVRLSEKLMKVMIYVDGFLIFVSKELPMLKLRGLDDVPQKQEGVPYTISIGGGTQGLLESIQLDYYNQPDYTLPIEKNFCGSFIGDIKGFRSFQCPLEYENILRETK